MTHDGEMIEGWRLDQERRGLMPRTIYKRCSLATAPSTPSRKVTHTIDCIVSARNTGGTLNAELELLDDGRRVPIGACSMIGKPDAQPGDVVEVRYLYCPDPLNPRLVQPTLLRLRPDKRPEACTPTQLAFAAKHVLQETR